MNSINKSLDKHLTEQTNIVGRTAQLQGATRRFKSHTKHSYGISISKESIQQKTMASEYSKYETISNLRRGFYGSGSSWFHNSTRMTLRELNL